MNGALGDVVIRGVGIVIKNRFGDFCLNVMKINFTLTVVYEC